MSAAAPLPLAAPDRGLLDPACWPLVVWTYPRFADVALMRAAYRSWDELLERGPHAVLVDTRLINPLRVPPTLRKLMAIEVEKRRAKFERSLLAEARVVTHPLTRGLVTAFDWMIGNSFSRPLRNVSSLGEAEVFLRAELARHGLSASPLRASE
jgi:hypothetical protein